MHYSTLYKLQSAETSLSYDPLNINQFVVLDNLYFNVVPFLVDSPILRNRRRKISNGDLRHENIFFALKFPTQLILISVE